MGHKQVLLREDIVDLGARGEIVRVKAGYARNYLLPRKLAVEATTSNVKQIESERGALVKREAKERATADAQAEQLRNLTLKFERKIGEAGVLYGSVTSMDVAHALKEQGYEIDRRRIVMREPFKRFGNYTVPVRLHRDVTVELPVSVLGEGGIEIDVAALEAEAAAKARNGSAGGRNESGRHSMNSAEESESLSSSQDLGNDLPFEEIHRATSERPTEGSSSSLSVHTIRRACSSMKNCDRDR